MKYLIGLIIIWSICSCANDKNTNEQEDVASVKNNSLFLSDLQLQSFSLTSTQLSDRLMEQPLVLNGTMEVPPQSLLSVSSVLGGRVTAIHVRPGMYIKKGQVLAELEDPQFIQLQQDYLIADAQLLNAQAEYNRQRDLNENKASSDKVYLQAKADYETLRINHRSLAQKLLLANVQADQLTLNTLKKSITITAPFNGYVKEVFVNLGKYVSPGEILLEIVNPMDVQLSVKMFDQDWGKVNVGQQVVAYTNSDPDVKYTGKVVLIGKNIAEDRSLDVVIQLQSMSDKLIPGMYMNAAIKVPDYKASVLPEACIVDFEGGKYVFEIVDKNNFKMLPVTCGVIRNGWVEIRNKEAIEGKNIAAEGAYTLLMALKNEGEE